MTILRTGFIFCVIWCFLIVNVIYAEEVYQSSLLELVPRDAMAVIILKNKKDDAGLNFIKDSLKDRFSLEKSQERQKVINDISQMFNVKEIVAISFYTANSKPLFALLISYDKEDKDLINFCSEKINILFNNPNGVWSEEYLDFKIAYNPERFNQIDNKDLSCYTIIDNNLVIANDYQLLKKIIDNFLNKGGSILNVNSFNKIFLLKDPEVDGLIYITNDKKELTNSMQNWKEKIGFVPLVSSDLISSFWFAFNLKDKETAWGKIVFVPTGNESLEEINNDANYLMEVMRRKFMAEDLKYNKNISISENAEVVLDFEIGGLSILRDKIIHVDDESEENGLIEIHY